MKNLSLKKITVVSGIFVLSVCATGQAQTYDWNYPPKDKFQSTLSRDDIRNEYFKAAQNGTLSTLGELGTPQEIIAFQSNKTRYDVNAEYLQALKDGSLPPLGEDSPNLTAATFKSTLTRDQVVAETLDWMRSQRSDVMMGGN